jgi:DNA invertase Pin-like site-specific DNA recombinase
MHIGYARVSTLDQSPDLQLQALTAAGCEKVYGERASGGRIDRPELSRVLNDVLRPGDTLVVWKLDRLARSLKQLISTAEDLKGRNIGLVSLTEHLDTTTRNVSTTLRQPAFEFRLGFSAFGLAG